MSVLIDDLAHIRAVALGLPSVSERLSHGEPCFFVDGRRPLCYYHDDHNGDGRRSLWCPAPPGVAADLVAAEPARFYAPTPSTGGAFRGWLALYLDTDGDDRVDWDEVAALIHDAYRTIAPKRLVAELDGRRPT